MVLLYIIPGHHLFFSLQIEGRQIGEVLDLDHQYDGEGGSDSLPGMAHGPCADFSAKGCKRIAGFSYRVLFITLDSSFFHSHCSHKSQVP